MTKRGIILLKNWWSGIFNMEDQMKAPILRDIPLSFKTNRLKMRTARAGDGPTMAAAVRASLEHLSPWLPWAVEPIDEEKYEALMREWEVNFLARKELQFLIFTRKDPQLIGAIGCFAFNWDVPSLEIGYWIHHNWTRQGLMSEALVGLVDYCVTHLGCKRLEIRCDAQNQASAAVARRAGFVHEGTLISHTRHHREDRLRDTMIFGRVFP